MWYGRWLVASSVPRHGAEGYLWSGHGFCLRLPAHLSQRVINVSAHCTRLLTDLYDVRLTRGAPKLHCKDTKQYFLVSPSLVFTGWLGHQIFNTNYTVDLSPWTNRPQICNPTKTHLRNSPGEVEVWECMSNFHPTLYDGCNYLSMLRLKLINVSKRSPCYHPYQAKLETLQPVVRGAYSPPIVVWAPFQYPTIRHLSQRVINVSAHCTRLLTDLYDVN